MTANIDFPPDPAQAHPPVAELNIIFAGSGEFGLPTLHALLAANNRIAMVYTQPDRPAGRGKKLALTPIGQFASDNGLPLVRTQNINAELLPQADVMVVIAFGQKIAPHCANHPRLGSVNLHASLLPKYRGAAPINWAIIRGDTITGNSVIRLAPKMDAGPILAQSQLPIDPLDTAGEVHDRLAQSGATLVLDVLARLAENNAVEREQDHSLASTAPRLSRESAHIDWNRPAQEVASLIRGLYPWPGCRVRIVDEGGADRGRLTLVRARPVGAASAPPGTIQDRGLVAAGQNTAIEVVEVQPEGKRAMPLPAYCNGHPWQPRMRLESM